MIQFTEQLVTATLHNCITRCFLNMAVWGLNMSERHSVNKVVLTVHVCIILVMLNSGISARIWTRWRICLSARALRSVYTPGQRQDQFPGVSFPSRPHNTRFLQSINRSLCCFLSPVLFRKIHLVSLRFLNIWLVWRGGVVSPTPIPNLEDHFFSLGHHPWPIQQERPYPA